MSGTYYYLGDDKIGAYIEARFSTTDITHAESPDTAEAVFTYFPYASALEDAYFDDEGLIKSARPGTLLIDLSPASPTLSRELAAVAAVNDLKPVEAPLALLDPLKEDAFSYGNLISYVAGEPDDIEEAAGYLETIAETVMVAGASGRAQLSKAVHTIEQTAQVIGAIESWALLASSGAATDRMDRNQKPVAGLSGLLERVGECPDEQGYPLGFLMADIVAAMAAADDAELILPQLESALHLLELIVVIGGAEAGPALLRFLYRSEDEGAEHGLDWSRAEHLYGIEGESDHLHHYHDFDDDEDDEDDDFFDDGFDDFGFDDITGFAGGFSGYSTN